MTDRITISGAPRKYDELVLTQLREDYHKIYRQSGQCLELVQADFPYQFITTIIEKSKLGYVLCNRSPIRTLSLDYSAFMFKTPEMQQSDLAVIDAEVKAQYVRELQAELEEFKVKLTDQLLQAAELKERKREDDKKAKLLRDIHDEVNSTFSELVIPE